jgi:hypothetical protein
MKVRLSPAAVGRLRTAGSTAAALPAKAVVAACDALLAAALHVDLVVQRIAVALGIAALAAARTSSPEMARMASRVAVLGAALFVFTVYMGFDFAAITGDVEVPILGALESDVNLYYPPIGSNFLPHVADYNKPPRYRPRTPLLIPFTRNNTLMRQTVLSYISAGWPRADIIIVDNSGTMDANNRRLLSRANPFFLDYDMYRGRYGISVLQTPTLLNFAQLQNFMVRVAISRDWPYYFWSHMDVAVLSAEEKTPYKSFYQRTLDVLAESGLDQWAISAHDSRFLKPNRGPGVPSNDRKDIFASFLDRTPKEDPQLQAKKKRGLLPKKWGIKMFAYDYLTLVNVQAWRETGQWDPFIPYYNTDCDFYQRMAFAGYVPETVEVGHVFDVAEVVADPEARFFPARSQRARNRWGRGPTGPEQDGGSLASMRYRWLKAELQELVERKTLNPGGRNSWQSGAKDDRGPAGKDGKPKRGVMEPWTYDPRGFQAAWWEAADTGRVMYIKKWGTLDCDLKGAGKSLDDVWMLEYLEEGTEAYEVREKANKHQLEKLAERPIR